MTSSSAWALLSSINSWRPTRPLLLLRMCTLKLLRTSATFRSVAAGPSAGALSTRTPPRRYPYALLAWGRSSFIARSTQGERGIPIEEFFLGPFTTALEPEELLTEARVPRMTAGDRHGFAELARRSGDFALAAAAVVIPRDEGDIRISVVG